MVIFMPQPWAMKLYNSSEWKFARKKALRRDEYTCTKCGAPADEVHHVKHLTPENVGNPRIAFALDNLTSLCTGCHIAQHKSERERGNQLWKTPFWSRDVGDDYAFDENGMIVNNIKKVYLVTGCYGSGKTTYIHEHMSVGDLVVDMDYIRAALSFQDVHATVDSLAKTVFSVRDYLYEQVAARKGDWQTAWVSAGLPNRYTRAKVIEQLRAEHIEVKATREECIRRVMLDQTRPEKELHISFVNRWFDEYEKGI